MSDSAKSFRLRKGWRRLLFLPLLLIGIIVYLFLQRDRAETDFAGRIRDYERQIEQLASERDSLHRALLLRERQYRDVVDSLNVAINEIQTVQTQNRIQHENRRDSIVLMPDDELYRMVTGYIERYNRK